MDFQDKIDRLPQPVKDFFFSNDLRIEMEKACFLYGIEDEDLMSYASDLIASIFVEEIDLANFPNLILERGNLERNVAYGLAYELNNKIFSLFPSFFKDSGDLFNQWEKLKSSPIMSEQEAMNRVIEIEPWILEDEKEKIVYQKKIRKEKETKEQVIEKMTISQALQKYPEIGEQLITTQHIRLKIFPEPVRPSIKNWLSDYTFGLGYESHDSIVRGDYLFKSENGRILSPEEREKLSLIIKSYDENIPLSIDTTIKQVVFPEIQPKKEKILETATAIETKSSGNVITSKSEVQEPVMTTEPKEEEPHLEANNIKFSSPQVFANERNSEKLSIKRPLRISPVSRENFNGYFQKEEKLPKNVINLKE